MKTEKRLVVFSKDGHPEIYTKGVKIIPYDNSVAIEDENGKIIACYAHGHYKKAVFIDFMEE